MEHGGGGGVGSVGIVGNLRNEQMSGEIGVGRNGPGDQGYGGWSEGKLES